MSGLTTSLFHKAFHAGLMELPDAFWLQARHVLFPERENVTTLTDAEFTCILENYFRKGAIWILCRAYHSLRRRGANSTDSQ
ncbi:unnamed protein product [Symbiodinium sp. CCMP2592]|nr:unnamed protein product [Symbiodinium sp. CCMP2592]CAE7789415.1 unnamed protein product [Symbiodinium sp. CCMP2592]